MWLIACVLCEGCVFDGWVDGGVGTQSAFAGAFASVLLQTPWSVPADLPSLYRLPLCVYRQVDAFYNFWYGFKSWREFPHPDEEDIEQVCEGVLRVLVLMSGCR